MELIQKSKSLFVSPVHLDSIDDDSYIHELYHEEEFDLKFVVF